MSNLGYDPEAPSADELYNELINRTREEARTHRVAAAIKLGAAAVIGVGGTLFGVELQRLLSEFSNIPADYYDIAAIVKGAYIATVSGGTALATGSGVSSAIKSINAGSEAASLKAHHHHDMHTQILAREQAQDGPSDQPPSQPQ